VPETDPRPTDLRPADFDVPLDDPFANDRLRRRESVESLCSIIHNAGRPLVVSVEGAYGTGKSSYLRMCAARLAQLGELTVEFNAWQQGHTNRPLIDLVAALNTRLEGGAAWDKVKNAARQVGWRAAGALTKDLVAPLDADAAAVFQAWTDIENGVERFKSSLRDQVRGLDGKLVIFVDELDRCEPTYALDLLNKARHLFDVEGVAIVFGVNRSELEHAVQTQYGPKCDVDGYLRRFVDLSMQLRQPATDDWDIYMASLCDSLLDCARTLGDRSNTARAMLTLLADNCQGKLRDVEQVVRHANMILPHPEYTPIWPLWVLAMLTLRYLDRDCYERLVAGDADAWEVMLVMRKHLTRSVAFGDMAFVDAIILSLPGDHGVSRDRDEFVARYVKTRPGQAEAAASAFETRNDLRQQSRASMRSLDSLHKLIEIAAPI